MKFLYLRINLYLLRGFCPHLGILFVCVCVCVLFLLLSLRFDQISPLAFFRWFFVLILVFYFFLCVCMWWVVWLVGWLVLWRFKSSIILCQSHFNNCLLIGIILRWNFFIWELIFIYCGFFVLILVFYLCVCVCVCCFFFFHYVSTKFHLWPSSGDFFTATLDRNDESCNRIPSNYCLP